MISCPWRVQFDSSAVSAPFLRLPAGLWGRAPPPFQLSAYCPNHFSLFGSLTLRRHLSYAAGCSLSAIALMLVTWLSSGFRFHLACPVRLKILLRSSPHCCAFLSGPPCCRSLGSPLSLSLSIWACPPPCLQAASLTVPAFARFPPVCTSVPVAPYRAQLHVLFVAWATFDFSFVPFLPSPPPPPHCGVVAAFHDLCFHASFFCYGFLAWSDCWETFRAQFHLPPCFLLANALTSVRPQSVGARPFAALPVPCFYRLPWLRGFVPAPHLHVFPCRSAPLAPCRLNARRYASRVRFFQPIAPANLPTLCVFLAYQSPLTLNTVSCVCTHHPLRAAACISCSTSAHGCCFFCRLVLSSALSFGFPRASVHLSCLLFALHSPSLVSL